MSTSSSLMLLALFLVAIALGWYLSFRHYRKLRRNQSLPPAYLSGLDHLIDNRTEEAIESFIQALEVNSDNLPAHIALAKLLRRKGDIERAVSIHEKMLQRSDLSVYDRQRVKLALARDFFALGLLDRAEDAARPLALQSDYPELKFRALTLLIRLYEQEGEWSQALVTADTLPVKERKRLTTELAHYHCELAMQHLASCDFDSAVRALETAITTDSECVRANLMLARVYMQQAQWRQAIQALQSVADQEAMFIPETLTPLRRCYEALGEESHLQRYLSELMRKAPSTSVMLALAELKRDREGVFAAGLFITESLKQRPSVKGFNRLIDMHIEHGSASARESLLNLRSLTQQLEMSKPVYRCHHCGYSGRNLVWQCPSCKRWGSIRPIQGLEGE